MVIARGSSVVPWLSQTVIRLNLATRAHHAAADASWLELLTPAVDKRRYIQQLALTYGFEAPVEAAFRYTPNLGALIDLRARTRCGLLAQDLVRLGLSASQITDVPQRFVMFSSDAEALGWMYVLERATLLHGGVRRHLVQHLDGVSDATGYLSAYDDIADQRWTELGQATDALAASPLLLRQILRGATHGFRALCDWTRAGAQQRHVAS